jgi:hypothetical protein
VVQEYEEMAQGGIDDASPVSSNLAEQLLGWKE